MRSDEEASHQASIWRLQKLCVREESQRLLSGRFQQRDVRQLYHAKQKVKIKNKKQKVRNFNYKVVTSDIITFTISQKKIYCLFALSQPTEKSRKSSVVFLFFF